ncbi:GAF domain-containing sensor histidine kinase [Fibrella forsythiae]|uniref:histidine kinase n=1 Tax=Fibrella forsythiae TaxID=2817061 RepID=A0ABS3JCX5_9BACT|nr:ATP-binding protein [Fibrella forsythiae]MBO0947854.1 GAF domain-containing protein [Fibrella forsythiae]
MAQSDIDFGKDIERVMRIPLITTLLDVVCQTTGMGFAAVARVTEDKWIACSVRDDIQFGLVPGDELLIATTICNEIRDNQQPVIIDNVQANEAFRNHHTPKMYGFQSYISFPIVLKTGEFFGTLCAIDPSPIQLNNAKTVGMFTLFADLISMHLQQSELLEQTIDQADTLAQQVQERTSELRESVYYLQRSNQNLQQFAQIASHDLQEPLRKIQSFGDILQAKWGTQLGDDVDLLMRMQQAAKRMSSLIKDLLVYSRILTRQEDPASISLNQVVADVLKMLEINISEANAQVTVTALPVVQGDSKQLEQLFQNLLSNALKFRRKGIPSQITVGSQPISAADLPDLIKPIKKVAMYHRVQVSDNGIGFDGKYVDRMFQVFQRLHSKNEFTGTGIGLAICEKVVNNHGGIITATSQPGSGSTFSVYLPG